MRVMEPACGTDANPEASQQALLHRTLVAEYRTLFPAHWDTRIEGAAPDDRRDDSVPRRKCPTTEPERRQADARKLEVELLVD